MSGWRTIDTAPKDGTWVDVWCDDSKGYAPGRFTCVTWLDGAWRFPSYMSKPGTPGQALVTQPTHWMPIPGPPETEPKGRTP